MDVSKKVTLVCSICGSEKFNYDEKKYASIDEAEEFKCVLCNKEYTREELKEANIERMKEEAAKMAKEELKKRGFDVR